RRCANTDWRDIMVAATPVRKSTEGTGEPPGGPRSKRRLLLMSPFLVAGIYALFVVAWVAPPSPVKERVQPVLNAAFKPYFQQPVSDTDAAAQWQMDLLEARHMLSRLADSTAASGQPVAVRLLVTGQFVPPSGGAPTKRNLLVDTGWLPYLPGGAR